jgi:hypothetical protein
MVTLVPDAVSTWPVPTDWTDGLVQAEPHAVVDAPADPSADSRLAGTASAEVTAKPTRYTFALLNIPSPSRRFGRRWARPTARAQVGLIKALRGH